MKTLRDILFVVIAAALGWLIGAPRGETRDVSPNGNTRPENGSSTASAAQAAADDALVKVLTALRARTDLRALAQLGSLLDALDGAQFAALFDRLDRLPDTERETLLPRLLAYWTKRDAKAATAWMEPRLARFAKDPNAINGFFRYKTELVDAWSENAPELALEYARQHPWSGLTEHLMHSVCQRWPDKDKPRMLAILQSFPPGKEREKVSVAFFFSWAQSDRTAALAAAAALPPGPERERGLGEVLAHWAGRKPAEAFAKAQALGVSEPAVLAIMAHGGAKSDPAATARWLEAQDAALLPQLGGLVVTAWAEKNPAAAFEWARAHGLSPMDGTPRTLLDSIQEKTVGHGYEMNGNPFAKALREKPDALLAWVRALPVGAERERYLVLTIGGLDPAKAQPLLAELPPEAAARAAAQIAARLSRDIEKARQYVESLPAGPMREQAWTAIGATRTDPVPLPPGPDRDAMLSGLAGAWSRSQPVKSLDRVLEIADPALRRRTFDDIFWKLHRGPIELGHGSSLGGAPEASIRAASEWLEKANVPEDWKQPWRK